MKVGRKAIKMTNLIPWSFSPTSIGTKSIADTKRVKINEANIKWVSNLPKASNTMTLPWPQEVDEFEYPTLDELRSQFEVTGLYSKKRLDEIMKVYGRLPKYQKGGRSTSRSKKRG